MQAPPVPIWPLLVYFILVALLIAAMLLIAHVVGERRSEQATGEPYESGMVPTGSARIRFPADFYLIAMFFVIFDVETVFIVSWAITARTLGWMGYTAVALFIGVLLVSLGYLWRAGALDWGPGRWRHGILGAHEREEHAENR